MSKEIFKSHRYFVLHDFIVSHGQLLLRSDKRKGYDANVDIIFFDTTYIQLSTSLDGIVINVVNYADFLINNPVNKNLSHVNKFLIESNDDKYIIVASFFRVFENQLEFHETSLGFENNGREKEIASSL